MSDSVVADGVYRFQNITIPGRNDYVTLRSTGEVQGATLNASSDTQKWTVTKRADNLYDIANAGTGELLAVAAPHGSETAFTLNVKGDIKIGWGLDPYGSKVEIKASAQFTGKVADLSDGNRIVLWDRNGLPNQTWILEATEPPSPPPPTLPQWITVKGSAIPRNAVKGGKDANGKDMYVARYTFPDGIPRTGNASPSLEGICKICDGVTEKTLDTYDVLVASIQWVPCPLNQLNPAGIPWQGKTLKPVIIGTGVSWGSTFVVRMPYNTIVSVGFAANVSSNAWVGDLNGKMITYSPPNSCDVLCYAEGTPTSFAPEISHVAESKTLLGN